MQIGCTADLALTKPLLRICFAKVKSDAISYQLVTFARRFL
jgi:hypothetical protein